eukprot:jgi/Tetstr1/447197/TSEL_034634.t1
MDFRDKLVYAFNTFFGDFLNHAKTVDDTIKRRLKKKYRVIDRSANGILLEFCKEARKAGVYDVIADVSVPDKLLETRSVLDMHVAQAMPLGDVLSKADAAARTRVLGDVCMMCGVSRLYDELCEEAEGDSKTLEALFERLMEAMAMTNDGKSYESAFFGIFDDEICGIFRGILFRVVNAGEGIAVDPELQSQASAPVSGSGSGSGSGSTPTSTSTSSENIDMEGILNQMKNSKLGEIAEEISQTIDKDQLAQAFAGGQGFETVIQGLMTGQNVGLIGDLVQQVGNKINSKLQEGDMKEEDLLKDAFSLMGRMRDFAK